MNIGFIGVGKLGKECAQVVAAKGHFVEGYDVNHVEPNNFQMVQTIEEVCKNKDIVFIAVPTPHDPMYDGRHPTSHLEPKDFNYDIVKSCLTEANKHMNDKQLLVLISTVLPGTTRREFIQLITNTRFVYNPYLIAMGTVAWDMVNPEMVMIGTEDGSENGDAKQLIDFYKSIMENDPRYIVGTWDECECIKIFYNTFISAKIGLVNMIQDVAEKQGNINVDVVTDALANSTQRIMGSKYMKAGMGDGGACHPRDNIALRYLAQELDLGYDLFDSIMTAREIQAKNIAIRLASLSRDYDLPVCIMGKSYKKGVGYLDGSYSILIGSYLERYGINPIYSDPFEIEKLEPLEAVFLLAHPFSKITDLYVKPMNGSIVLDPWRSLSLDIEGIKVIHYGNTRN
jgi:UDPglucose 6-dehydrogenase